MLRINVSVRRAVEVGDSNVAHCTISSSGALAWLSIPWDMDDLNILCISSKDDIKLICLCSRLFFEI